MNYRIIVDFNPLLSFENWILYFFLEEKIFFFTQNDVADFIAVFLNGYEVEGFRTKFSHKVFYTRRFRSRSNTLMTLKKSAFNEDTFISGASLSR